MEVRSVRVFKRKGMQRRGTYAAEEGDDDDLGPRADELWAPPVTGR